MPLIVRTGTPGTHEFSGRRGDFRGGDRVLRSYHMSGDWGTLEADKGVLIGTDAARGSAGTGAGRRRDDLRGRVDKGSPSDLPQPHPLGGALAGHLCPWPIRSAGGLRRGWDRPDSGAAGARGPAECSRRVFSGAQDSGRGRRVGDRCCDAVRRSGRPYPRYVGRHAVLRPLSAC